MKNLWLFKNYLTYYWRRLTLLYMVILLTALSEGIGIGLFFPLIDYIQKGNKALIGEKFKIIFNLMSKIGIETNILNFILVIFIVILFSLINNYFVKVISTWTYNQMTKKIRDDGFEKIINLPMQYFQTISSGKLVNIFIGEVENVGQSLNYLIQIIVKSTSVIVYTTVLFITSLKLTVIVIFMALIRYWIIGLFIQKSRTLGDSYTKMLSKINTYIVGIYQGIDVVKTYATEEKEHKRFRQMTIDFMNNVSQADINAAKGSLIENTMGLGLLCAIIYVSIVVLNLEATYVLVFLFIVTRLVPIVSTINDARIRIAEYTSRIIYLKNIFLQDTNRPFLPHRWGSIIKNDFNYEIKFEKVRFSYHNDINYSLKDIDLTIFKDENIAIIGESGAGKTTFVRLLLRLYDPQFGKITIDGIELSDIHRDCWRNLVSVVSQDTFVFDDTIENNIKYGSEHCTQEAFWNAVERAKAGEFIDSLPKKEKTEIGERGVKLSGGQRQRIAIARSFLRSSPILILDEATSALDSVTENIIHDAIVDLSKNRTVIIIAHRLSTIRNANRIVVLDKGAIAEVGTNTELIENGYLYKKYHSMQLF
ncbi:Xenobiotic-transporting ATPase [Candidatus Magnetobacterium bavaricum]|uniref:Multidrug resistance-like ATP-binding protein MdlB n=1 Tax=Candidatus Magnetobacterium bavaricum TaxID=29290 RepID=A0A0F3GJK9_9BACT|nr:Xenobiotic-transporting ATPase [Candidatus Magnetobacterium bavaricum]